METWWIVKTPRNPVIERAHLGTVFVKIAMEWGVGPFWSEEEAQVTLGKWFK